MSGFPSGQTVSSTSLNWAKTFAAVRLVLRNSLSASDIIDTDDDDSARVYLSIADRCLIGCNNTRDGVSQEYLDKVAFDGEHKDHIYFNGIYILSFLKNFKDFVSFNYYQTTNTIILSKNSYPIYMTKAMKERKSGYEV